MKKGDIVTVVIKTHIAITEEKHKIEKQTTKKTP